MNIEENVFLGKCKKYTVILKTLIEMMSQISPSDLITDDVKSIKQICLNISEKSIQFYSDSKKPVVSTFALIQKEMFDIYEFKEETSLCIGISLDILKTCFKYVRRNDELKIILIKSEYNTFPDKIKFTLNDTKGFIIKCNPVQNIDLDDFDDYTHLVKIQTSKFSNLYKEIGGVKKKVNIAVKNNSLVMSSNMVDIAEKWINFPLDKELIINQTTIVRSEHFKVASKISTFDNCVNLCMDKNGNILLKTNIRKNELTLGHVNVCILNQNIRN